jgi:hypothetical protein
VPEVVSLIEVTYQKWLVDKGDLDWFAVEIAIKVNSRSEGFPKFKATVPLV